MTFDEWWFDDPYRAQFGPDTRQYQIASAAWKRQQEQSKTNLEWNRNLVKACDYEATAAETTGGVSSTSDN